MSKNKVLEGIGERAFSGIRATIRKTHASMFKLLEPKTNNENGTNITITEKDTIGTYTKKIDGKWYAISTNNPKFSFCGNSQIDVLEEAVKALKYYAETGISHEDKVALEKKK